MAVTPDDVRHIALLARLGVADALLPALVSELNQILGHMAVLAEVKTVDVAAIEGVGAAGTPLRADLGPPYPLNHSRESFAPAMRDGFYLVPRLATHEASEESGA